MSPLPIRKNNEDQPLNDKSNDFSASIFAQDSFNLMPFLEQLYNMGSNSEDKKILKELWVNSKSLGRNMIEVNAGFNENYIKSLKTNGIIEGSGNKFTITSKGSKLLRDAILTDEQSSLTKKASKKMISKSSYDFGDKVLVRVAHPEKFGVNYATVDKSAFENKNIEPRKIVEHKIATRKQNGSEKELKDFTDEELITSLHLAKTIIENSQNIRVSGSKFVDVPVSKYKKFSEDIMRELNTRKR